MKSRLVRAAPRLSFLLLTPVLFTLSFPSVVSPTGLPLLAPLFFTAILAGMDRLRGFALVAAGFSTGFLCYSGYNFWLFDFHPIAYSTVTILSGLQFALLFPLLKKTDGSVAFAAVYALYEWLKSTCFPAYPYGKIAESVVDLAWVSASASVLGTIPVTFIIAYLGASLYQFTKKRPSFPAYWKNNLVLLAGFAMYGLMSFLLPIPRSDGSLNTLSVQRAIDPRIHGAIAYSEALERQIALSELALEKLPIQARPSLILWPETAVVPPIVWHAERRISESSTALADRFLGFSSRLGDIGLLTGNGKREIDQRGTVKDYNAALLFERGINTDGYAKTRLVPFFEYYPFPWPQGLRRYLEANGSFWEAGTSVAPIEFRDVKIGVMICFEEGFSTLGRSLIKEGANVLVSLVDDGWANSRICELQHLAASRYRAIETGRTLLRVTNTGLTCVATPRGTIDASIPPGIPGTLVTEAPLYRHLTAYAVVGDVPALALMIVVLIAPTARRYRRRKRPSLGREAIDDDVDFLD